MKKFFNIFYDKLIQYYFLILGSLWILIYIYLRFFAKRSSYDLSTIKGHLSTIALSFIIFLLLLNICIIIINSRILLYRYMQWNSNPGLIVKTLIKILDVVYWKPLLSIYDIIAPKIPYSGVFFMYIGKILLNSSINTTRLCVVLFDYFPRLLVAIVFCIDITIFNKLHYFLYVVGLIIIPILYSILVKLFNDFAVRNIPVLETPFIITPTGKPNQYNFKIKKEWFNANINDLKEYQQTWVLLIRFWNYGKDLKTIKEYYLPIILIICSIIYVFTWTYYLWYCFS